MPGASMPASHTETAHAGWLQQWIAEMVRRDPELCELHEQLCALKAQVARQRILLRDTRNRISYRLAKEITGLALEFALPMAPAERSAAAPRARRRVESRSSSVGAVRQHEEEAEGERCPVDEVVEPPSHTSPLHFSPTSVLAPSPTTQP